MEVMSVFCAVPVCHLTLGEAGGGQRGIRGRGTDNSTLRLLSHKLLVPRAGWGGIYVSWVYVSHVYSPTNTSARVSALKTGSARSLLSSLIRNSMYIYLS